VLIKWRFSLPKFVAKLNEDCWG